MIQFSSLRGLVLASSLAVLAAACQAVDPESVSDSGKMTIGVGVPVTAAGETPAVGTEGKDAADDPEIWVDPANPARGVIVGTDKQAGLYVFDLAGKPLQFVAAGRINNVDLRPGFPVEGRDQVLIAASDRDHNAVAFFLLDPATLQVRPFGVAPLPTSEAYGFCLGRRGERIVAVMVGKDGDVRQADVSAGPSSPVLTPTRAFAVGSQSEGCVVDDQAQALYVAEEAKGIWRYDLDPATGPRRTQLAAAPSTMLKPDVEGLTLLREGAKTWLIASSQGDSAFAVWSVEAAPRYVGRFSVVGGHGADPVTGTDGLAAHAGPAGAFPEGLIVVQDDSDTEGEAPAAGRTRQNFKLVDWRDVKKALGL